MKKREYLSPQMKVGKLQQIQIICASTETLTKNDFYWEEE